MQCSSQQITEADLQLIEIKAVQGPRRIVEFGTQSIYVIDIVVQDTFLQNEPEYEEEELPAGDQEPNDE